MDLFASAENNQCERFYSLQWCRGSVGCDAFAFDWSGESAWVICPYRMIWRVWRKLRREHVVATVIVPLWSPPPAGDSWCLMPHTSLARWWIGCSLTGATRTSLSRGRRLAGGSLSRRTCHY